MHDTSIQWVPLRAVHVFDRNPRVILQHTTMLPFTSGTALFMVYVLGQTILPRYELWWSTRGLPSLPNYGRQSKGLASI